MTNLTWLKVITVGIALVVGGCSNSIEFADPLPNNVPVGEFPADYVDIANKHLNDILLFDSAEYSFAGPPKLAYPRNGSSDPIGWLACGTVDSYKARYGATYKGAVPFAIIIRNSLIVAVEFGFTDNAVRCLAAMNAFQSR